MVTGRNDWNLSSCDSKELVKWHWLLVVVSQVGVCLGEKSPQILPCLTGPHALHETRLDLLRQAGELWGVVRCMTNQLGIYEWLGVTYFERP